LDEESDVASVEVLTPKEAAAILHVSVEKILSWIERGKLIGVPDRDGSLVIPRPAFDAYRNRHNGSIPESLLRPRDWDEALRWFENHFGLSTDQLLDLEAEGKHVSLSGPEEETLYSHWKSMIRLMGQTRAHSRSA
jgi:excisionase family DNA binding protein